MTRAEFLVPVSATIPLRGVALAPHETVLVTASVGTSSSDPTKVELAYGSADAPSRTLLAVHEA